MSGFVSMGKAISKPVIEGKAEMKKVMMAMIGLAAMAGCATRQAVELEERDDRLLGMMRLEAKHARLKSVLGIDDAVLSDTNRFVLGSVDYSQEFKLDKPFGGFVDARIYLDDMDEPDCRDKLAKALRDGIERQTQRAKRKPARGKEKKGDEKNVGASTNTV